MASTPPLGPPVNGDTLEFKFSGVLRNGVSWDMAGATIELLLLKPSAATVTRTATLALGVASYIETLDEAGPWQRAWRVTLSGRQVTTTPYPFTVYESLV